jgi:probable F420-dependent oxidoreductase
MKVGILAANTMPHATPAGAAALARAAEAAGIESLWTVEHVLWPDGYDSTYPYAETGRMPGPPTTVLPDPFVWLTWVAAHSHAIRLGTGITIVPHRHPAMLAKEAASLDVLSAGRLLLGVGVGWLREEFDALGVPFDGRGQRTDEYIAVMRALWASDSVSHTGEFVSFAGMNSNPKPVNGSVPIVVGGHSRRAAERAAALGDGFAPLGGDVRELVEVMRQHAADLGRRPESIEITATHEALFSDDPTAAVEELASWGVQRVVFPAFRLGRGDVSENCQAWADKLGVGPGHP